MTTNILLLGGHGRISLLLTPLLLTNPSHHVTSVIRNPSHRREILALKETHPDKHPGKLSVLVSSLDDIHTPTDARRVLQQTSPKWIIWSAGAGGKGGPERTHAVDCRAAKCYIAAAVEEGSGVERFLMVSYVSSCRGYRSWWGEEDRRAADKVNLEVLPAYARAKIEADEFLAASSRRWEEEESDGDGGQGGERKWALCLRPATLTDEGAGRVLMGEFCPAPCGFHSCLLSTSNGAIRWG